MAIGVIGIVPATVAQIVPDNTLPTNSSVPAGCDQCNITNGTVQGNNLFHSFETFSVPTNGSANFINIPSDVRNILTRITGTSGSTIDGTISVEGTANLFLINPNGILFGPNASLNLGGGSFVATTANAIQFGDRGLFSASNPEPPSSLLSINPSALVYNQLNQGAAIVNRSTTPLGSTPGGLDLYGLGVSPGNSIALIGGDVRLEGGGIRADGGRVELGGLTTPGTIGLTFQPDGLHLQFPNDINRADVSLSNAARISVAAAGGGSVGINARNVQLSEGSVIRGGIETGATALRPAGDIVLNATSGVQLDGINTTINNNFRPNGLGNAGDIVVNTNALNLSSGANISVSTLGAGAAGNLIVDANAINLSSGASLVAQTQGSGKGGNIFLKTNALNLSSEAKIDVTTFDTGVGGNLRVNTNILNLSSEAKIDVTTFDTGAGGDLIVEADAINLSSGTSLAAQVQGSGKGGNILLTTNTLNLSSKAKIDATTFDAGAGGNLIVEADAINLSSDASLVALTEGQGDAGKIWLTATDSINLTDSKIIATVTKMGIGQGGTVQLKTPTLTLQKSSIATSTDGKGDAGSVIIDTNSLMLQMTNITTDTTRQGNAGKISIDAHDSITLDKSSITSSVLDSGTRLDKNGMLLGFRGEEKGGDIRINTGTLSLINGSLLASQVSGKGDAGNIEVTAQGTVLVDGAALIDGKKSQSTISTVVRSFEGSEAIGNAGKIQIKARSLFVINGGSLLAGTFAIGNAGDISIWATEQVVIDGGSRQFVGISTTVFENSTGRGGNIKITTPVLAMNNKGSLFAGTVGQGRSGDINLWVSDRISLNDGSLIFSGSRVLDPKADEISTSPNSNAGNITIQSGKLALDRSYITTETTSGNGGDMDLRLNQRLLLRNQSKISTSAGTGEAGGNGGNITITVPKGFVVGVLKEDSDISANAFTGNGGRVKITAQGIYGLQFQPRPTSSSDITASSTLGVSGTVEINRLGLDPSGSLTQLPIDLVDPSQQINRQCAPRGVGRNGSFVITGSGGIPASPIAPVVPTATIMDLVPLPNENGHQPSATQPTPIAPPTTPIVEANGWQINQNGDVQLVANSSNPSSPNWVPPTCSASIAGSHP